MSHTCRVRGAAIVSHSHSLCCESLSYLLSISMHVCTLQYDAFYHTHRRNIHVREFMYAIFHIVIVMRLRVAKRAKDEKKKQHWKCLLLVQLLLIYIWIAKILHRMFRDVVGNCSCTFSLNNSVDKIYF